MKDRSWFERKVRDLGDVLRRLPRRRRRALVTAIDTEPMDTQKGRYPEHPECRLIMRKPGEKPEWGTYTPPEPYGVTTSAPSGRADGEPADARQKPREGTGGQLHDDEGESR